MKSILFSLSVASVLLGANGDSQSILSEVSNLRQKYDECRASKDAIKGIDPKVLTEAREKNQKLSIEISRKNGVIKSLEQTLVLRDRTYRETNARNKNLTAQLHTQQVTQQEREMLKRALVAAKGELALAQKELKGGSSSILQVREELKAAKATLAKLQSQPSKVQIAEKIVTKVVEPTEKIKALQSQLNAANMVITQLRSTPSKTQEQPLKVIYKDRIVTQEKVVYKDRPVEKVVVKTVEPTAKIQALTHELANAQVTISTLKNSGAKVVYKDRIVTQEKIVYKERPVEKIVTKTVVVEKPIIDENMRRKMDKLALELERERTLNLKLAKDLAKAPVKRSASAPLPPLPPISQPHAAVKTTVAANVKSTPPATANTSGSSKKSSGVYRMASDAPIYSTPNGKVIDTWEARRSFTGSSAANGWIHITGYFVNRVFQGVSEGESLWVKESDAIRRQ